MLHAVKRLVPQSMTNTYHRIVSYLAALRFGFPSEELIVIGVTGTNGKTTVSYMLAKALEAQGDVTGCTTTAMFKIGKKEWLNDKKMTMLGRFQLQKMLRDMVKAGCKYAVIETSSQGVVQHRHRHINYDMAIFTNLTPEHIEAHGSFENYKQAKIELFRHLAKSKRKMFGDKKIQKIAILNRMDEYSKEFIVPGLDAIGWFGIGPGEGLNATDLRDEGWSTSFTVNAIRVNLHMPGEVNVENAMAAIAAATAVGLPLPDVMKKIETFAGMPGRFERIDLQQPYTVIVDYAPEPASLARLYAAVKHMPHNRLIHVLGSCGGGRDVARRPILGSMAAEHAEKVIITNEDPYDDNPREIMDQVEQGALSVGKAKQDVQIIEDRREAIFTAMKQAQPGDLVLLTGKGCEQGIMVANGKQMKWDEREVAKAAILSASGTRAKV